MRHNYSTRFFVSFFLFFTLSNFRISGQKIDPDLQKKKPSTELLFGFENSGFFKNNEYKGNIVKGYTLTGAWVRPKLILFFSDRLKFEAGWHYLKYNGKSKPSISVPWISSTLNLGESSQMILGNLNYTGLHRLILPMWEPERVLTDNPESGLQFLHHSNKIFFDTWVNWEQFIQKGDQFQEHFTFGNSFDWKFIHGNKFEISYPFQALFFHQGGEIDTSPLRVQTVMNLATGIKSAILTEGIINKISFSVYSVQFRDLKGNAELPVEDGSGWFLESGFKTNYGDLNINYWKGKDFISVKGMKLLQSRSDEDAGLWKSSRRMLGMFYTFERRIFEGINAGIRAEGWFHLDSQDFSNSGFVYILISQQFLVRKL